MRNSRKKRPAALRRFAVVVLVVALLIAILFLVLANLNAQRGYGRDEVGYVFGLLEPPGKTTSSLRKELDNARAAFERFDELADSAGIAPGRYKIKSILYVKCLSAGAPSDAELKGFLSEAQRGRAEKTLSSKQKKLAEQVYETVCDLLYSAPAGSTHAEILAASSGLGALAFSPKDLGFPLEAGSYYVSSLYGPRGDPTSKEAQQQVHSGIDLAAAAKTPVFAAAGGYVVLARRSNEGYGNVIAIYHGGGVATLYAHCAELYAEPGDEIQLGQHIADVGATGNTTGPHLHFEVIEQGQPVNPRKYFPV